MAARRAMTVTTARPAPAGAVAGRSHTALHRALCVAVLVSLLVSLLIACGADHSEDRLLGTLASDRVELVVEVSEPIVAIAVAEGEDLEAGEEILRQDSQRARAQLAEAEAAVGVAEARLAELLRGPRPELIAVARADFAGAVDDLAFHERELNRFSELQERQLSSPESVDRARAQRDAAQATLQARRARLEELLAGTTAEELRQAEQSLAQARAQRERVAVGVERHTLTAPVAGRLDTRLFEVGERPAAGQPVAILLAGTQPHAQLYIPERLRARVTPGLAARIYLDGVAQPFTGSLRWVSSEAAFTPYYALTERDRGHLSYLAKVDIDLAGGTGQRLPEGLPVEVELLFPDAGE
jgi:HlyD family secretion protein